MDAPAPGLSRESALEFLYGRINYERNDAKRLRKRSLNLDRMRDLLKRLGNPQDQLTIVHVAGTKGKGSTAGMISSILSNAGFRTGLYTSPHLEHLEERVTVDGRRITSDELVALTQVLWPAVAEMDLRARAGGPEDIGPTFFELTTSIALLHFLRSKVDFAVVEVGMGGRLDSTNVCTPVVSVITSISFDHTRQLGNTLREIAFEKAGIIKVGVPVVSGVAPQEPKEVIQRVARERNCALYQIGEQFEFSYSPPARLSPTRLNCGRLNYWESGGNSLDDTRLGLLGAHQAANAAVAVATIKRLGEQGWVVPAASIRGGLAHVRCPARIEVLEFQPTVIVDTAHNVASIEALLNVVRDAFLPGPRLLIFASTREKDPAGMLRRLLPEFDEVILTRYLNNPRAASPAELGDLAAQISASELDGKPHKISVQETPEQAWQLCRDRVSAQHLVCVTGSFFLAAEMRALIQAGSS
jgi:dihydrofolate synthase/folylpolyglutamate synthase